MCGARQKFLTYTKIFFINWANICLMKNVNATRGRICVPHVQLVCVHRQFRQSLWSFNKDCSVTHSNVSD